MTLPTEFLRGRMGFSYLNTMDITELCATNISEYVEIAVRLGKDINFYNYIRTVIKDRAYLIWEDMEIPYRWSSILSTAVGLTPLSWDAFLFESGRNVALETSLREQRNKFRKKEVIKRKTERYYTQTATRRWRWSAWNVKEMRYFNVNRLKFFILGTLGRNKCRVSEWNILIIPYGEEN